MKKQPWLRRLDVTCPRCTHTHTYMHTQLRIHWPSQVTPGSPKWEEVRRFAALLTNPQLQSLLVDLPALNFKVPDLLIQEGQCRWAPSTVSPPSLKRAAPMMTPDPGPHPHCVPQHQQPQKQKQQAHRTNQEHLSKSEQISCTLQPQCLSTQQKQHVHDPHPKHTWLGQQKQQDRHVHAVQPKLHRQHLEQQDGQHHATHTERVNQQQPQQPRPSLHSQLHACDNGSLWYSVQGIASVLPTADSEANQRGADDMNTPVQAPDATPICTTRSRTSDPDSKSSRSSSSNSSSSKDSDSSSPNKFPFSSSTSVISSTSEISRSTCGRGSEGQLGTQTAGSLQHSFEQGLGKLPSAHDPAPHRVSKHKKQHPREWLGLLRGLLRVLNTQAPASDTSTGYKHRSAPPPQHGSAFASGAGYSFGCYDSSSPQCASAHGGNRVSTSQSRHDNSGNSSRSSKGSSSSSRRSGAGLCPSGGSQSSLSGHSIGARSNSNRKNKGNVNCIGYGQGAVGSSSPLHVPNDNVVSVGHPNLAHVEALLDGIQPALGKQREQKGRYVGSSSNSIVAYVGESIC